MDGYTIRLVRNLRVEMVMKKNLVVLACLVSVLVGYEIARCSELRGENLYAKYTGLALQESAAFALGNIDAWAWNGGKSYWPPYNRDIWHLHDGLMFCSTLASYISYSRWKPQYSIFSERGFVFVTGNLLFTSWVHQRGIRLVQTGKLFPSEKGHGFYVRWKWINLEIKSSDKLQWSLFGTGIVLLTLDAIWERFGF